MTAKEDRKVATTAGGAISLSAIASFIGLCCIGPWAVALFGVPGAVYLARWQPVRPYLLGLAVMLILWAFWRVYRPQRPCDAEICVSGPSRWLKLFLWVGAALLVMALFADQLQWLIVDPTPEGLRK